ncbi:MAG: protein kinase domain-containing protein [Acidimicrobiales bacterium]
MAEFTPPFSSSPSPRSGVKAGDLIAGRYRLTRQVAQGGMAQVWEAHDDVLTRPVAVKILLSHLAANHSFVARFRQEALASARLSHQNIVSVYDTCSQDVEAIVMELIEGQTLRQTLDIEKVLSPEIAIDIAIQVAEGLDHAHHQGLVHRDIKPGNILLDNHGQALITDFGIAKAESHADLTEVNQVVGTAKYLSPEQVGGGYVDTRSDLYSLGIVLHEMLCGQPPFVADSSAATAIVRLTQDPVPLRQVHPSITATLEHVVLCCLTREPNDRYPSARHLIEALGDAAVDLDQDSTSFRPLVTTGPATTTMQRVPALAANVSNQTSGNKRRALSRSTWTLLGIMAATLALIIFALASTGPGQSLLDRLAGRVGLQVGPLEPLAIAGVSSFDPFGSGGEHDDKLSHIVDDNPETGWTTERYQKPDVAGFKQGVGFILSLEQATRVETLELETPTVGWQASFYVANEIKDDLASWGEPVAIKEGLSGAISVDLHGRSGSHVLVWITHLGDGRVGPRYSTQINNARLLG